MLRPVNKPIDADCIMLVFTCIDEDGCDWDTSLTLEELLSTGVPCCPLCGKATEFFYARIFEKASAVCLTKRARGG